MQKLLDWHRTSMRSYSETNKMIETMLKEEKEHCDWEEQDEPTDDQIFNNHSTEGGISFNNNSTWQGR